MSSNTQEAFKPHTSYHLMQFQATLGCSNCQLKFWRYYILRAFQDLCIFQGIKCSLKNIGGSRCIQYFSALFARKVCFLNKKIFHCRRGQTFIPQQHRKLKILFQNCSKFADFGGYFPFFAIHLQRQRQFPFQP